MQNYDVLVIGAGVMGCMVAHELSRYAVRVCVLERAHDVGEGSSKANSGIIHAGFHPRGGSLKGISCVEGNAAYPKLCEELEVSFKRCGALMVAFDDEGLEKLKEKAARAEKNGAGKLEIVSGDVARELEPALSKEVRYAMLAPTTGIISPFELVLALAQNAAQNGVDFEFNAHVERIEAVTACDKNGEGGEGEVGAPATTPRYVVVTKDGRRFGANFVVNMSGDEAHVLDACVHPADYEVKPRLGEYIVFDKQDSSQTAAAAQTSAQAADRQEALGGTFGTINHVIYQAAQTDEGGTLLAPTVDGNLLVGPTSTNTRDFHATATTQQGLDHIRRVAKKLVPSLNFGNVIRNFAGARTNIVNVSKELKDFVVRVSAPGFVSALGIKNPGMTSSPYLAKMAVGLLIAEGMPAEPNACFNPHRKKQTLFLQMSAVEQAAALKADPTYANVICRCEGVTEGDIRAAMHADLAPTTMAGVKRRLRVSMGRCQGAFCEPRLVDIMADELGVAASKIPYGEHGGKFVQREVK